MMHFRHMIFIGVISFLGVFGLFLADSSVLAQQPLGQMMGYGWSDAGDPSDQNNFAGGAYGRGGGWISFSSSNPEHVPAPSQSWQVNIDPNTGNMSGYAYSSFLGATYSGGMSPVAASNASGYIRFTTVSGEVTPDGFAPAVMARLDIQNARMEGWARACAVFQSGCSGALLDPLLRGGWDGWISLRGNGYGIDMVSYDPITGMAELYGYAWGDMNLGWIFLKNVTVQLNPNPPVYCTNIGGGPHYFIPSGYVIDPTDSTLCNPVNIPPSGNPRLAIYSGCYIKNEPVQVDWTTLAVQPGSCTIDSSPDASILSVGNIPMSSNLESGSYMSNPMNAETTFVLSCIDLNNNPVSRQVISSMCPANMASVNLNSACTTTSETTLYWDVNQATICTTNILPSLNISLNNGSASGSMSNIPVGQNYNISCIGQDGNSVNRNVYPTTALQCTPTGTGIPRPGYQEI